MKVTLLLALARERLLFSNVLVVVMVLVKTNSYYYAVKSHIITLAQSCQL